MSLNLPVTRRKIRNHFQYSLWKYLLLVVIALFGWNLIYTTTRYRPPENLKVEFFAEGDLQSGEAAQALADRIHAEAMPEMEEVTATTVTFDDAYGDMQLTVWVSAGQGDVYLLSRQRYDTFTDATLDLTPYIASGALNVTGLDLTDGYMTNPDTGARELHGIPTDSLAGLSTYGLIAKDRMLCVLYNNGNDEYAIRFLNELIARTRAADATPSPTAAP